MPTDLTSSRTRSNGPVARATKQISQDLARLHPVVLLYLLAVIIPVGFDAGTIAVTGLRLFLLVFMIPLVTRVFVQRVDRIYAVDVLFVLHVLWIYVAIGVNNPDKVIENATSTGMEFLGGYLLGRVYIRSAADMIALVRSILALALLSLFFAVPEALNGNAIIPDWISRVPFFTTVEQTDIPQRMGLNRAQVYFAHPIHYGLFCSTAFALTLVGLRNVMGTGRRVMWASLIGLGVFLSLSSGALLSVVLQLCLIIWGTLLRNTPNRWKILFALFALLYVTIDLASNRTPIKVFMTYATFSSHNAYWRGIIFDWGMLNVQENPIFGLGLRGWKRPSFMNSGSVDNFWLLMAMKGGYPGFVLVAGGYLHALYSVGRRTLTPGTDEANLRLGWMIMFIGLSFTLATVHVWTSIYSFVFFLLGSGMWLAGAPGPEGPAAAQAGPSTTHRGSRGAGAAGAGPQRRSRGAPVSDEPAADTRSARRGQPAAREDAGDSAPEASETAARTTRDGPLLTRFDNTYRRK